MREPGEKGINFQINPLWAVFRRQDFVCAGQGCLDMEKGWEEVFGRKSSENHAGTTFMVAVRTENRDQLSENHPGTTGYDENRDLQEFSSDCTFCVCTILPHTCTSLRLLLLL